MNVSPQLAEDLALVLPDVQPVGRADVTATVAGKSASVEEAIARAAALISRCSAPAVAGLHHLSIEALREAIALAEAMRGQMKTGADPVSLPVVQTASLGHVFACDLVIWIGRDSYDEDHPIAQAIAGRRLLASFVEATLDAVLKLRERFEVDPAHRRIAAILPPCCDGRVTSQWHKLAAQVQRRVRLCVFAIPERAAANARAVHEIITWQTGVAPTRGGVDFADGGPRACDAQTPSDLTIAIDHDGVTISDVHLNTPGLRPGLAARVMRCDGVILWLCDDPEHAPPDPLVEVLRRIRESVLSPRRQRTKARRKEKN